MDIINQVINAIIENFDFTFCIIVNILTYVIIKGLDECNGDKKVPLLYKRLVLIFSIIVIGTIYYIEDTNVKIIVNSAILAPVFWSWVAKPVCDKLDVGYKKDIDNELGF